MLNFLPRFPFTIDLNVSPYVDGVFVGFVFSTILTGINLLQAWNYACSNNDVWILRALVAVLVAWLTAYDSALDIATTCNNIALVHDYLIRHFGNILELTVIKSGFVAELALTVIIVFLVQLFFASRVYLLSSKSYWIPGSIIITSVIAFGVNIYNVVSATQNTNIFGLTEIKFKMSVIFGQGLTTIADIITSVALTLHFMRARSASRVPRTITILQKLLGYVVTRGLLVTVSNIVYMALYLFDPIKLYWVPIQLTLARLYILTLSIAPRFSLIPDFLLIFTYTTTATVVMLNARTSYKPSNDVITSFAHVHSFSLPTASSSRHTREPISLCSSTSKVSSCPKSRNRGEWMFASPQTGSTSNIEGESASHSKV